MDHEATIGIWPVGGVTQQLFLLTNIKISAFISAK